MNMHIIFIFLLAAVQGELVENEDHESNVLKRISVLEKEVTNLKINIFDQNVRIANQEKITTLEEQHERKQKQEDTNRLISQKTYRDCQDVQQDGNMFSGVYEISPRDNTTFEVYCDMHTDGGGWTVFHRRFGGYVDFYRNWDEYKTGFGNLGGEHWLGNEKIFNIVSESHYSLRINLEGYDNNHHHAIYSDFTIGDESSNYRLYVGKYSGNAGNSFQYNNNMMFSTKDKDNDNHGPNCAVAMHSGWWYRECCLANLNGLYSHVQTDEWRNNVWHNYPGGRINMISSTMMMRKI